MPSMDGTGPYGTGPVGRRMGPCSGNYNGTSQAGTGFGAGRGRGGGRMGMGNDRGMGRGAGFGAGRNFQNGSLYNQNNSQAEQETSKPKN